MCRTFVPPFITQDGPIREARFGADGGAADVETGLILQFTSTGAVKYMSGDTAPPY